MYYTYKHIGLYVGHAFGSKSETMDKHESSHLSDFIIVAYFV